jgi:hypothetical protein
VSDTTPEIEELIRTAIDSRLLDVNVSLPAIVVSYDATTQTCTVQIAIKRPLDTDDSEVVHETIAPIQNVPVGFQGGGTFSQHFSLTEGDTVLLVFSQWAFAQWRATGQISEAGDLRQHAPAYPVALPWYRPKGKPGPDSDEASMGQPDGLRLKFREDEIGVGDLSAPVALAPAVTSRLDALASALNGWVPVPNDGGAALKAALASWLGGSNDVASSNLKAD